MPVSTNDPYAAKAAFFDVQVATDWASRPYGPEEQLKLDRLFDVTGSLAGRQVLEPGCGTGRLTEVLARKVGPKGRVVAMDISPGMVNEARQRLAGFTNVQILQGPVEEKTGYTGHFDIAVCHQVFPHFSDPAGALTRMAGMLKPCGRMVISHFISSTEINMVHRKAGSAVARDMMPSQQQIRRWCDRCHFIIETWQDDDQGYLLSARLVRRNAREAAEGGGLT